MKEFLIHMFRPLVVSSYGFGLLSKVALRRRHRIMATHLLILSIVSTGHHITYKIGNVWHKIDKLVAIQLPIHLFLRCKTCMEVGISLYIFYYSLFLFNMVKKYPSPERDWKHIEYLIPHLLLHVTGLLASFISLKIR